MRLDQEKNKTKIKRVLFLANFPLCLTQTGRGPMFGNAKMQDGMLQMWCRFQRAEARERLRWKVKTCLVIHTKLFQQQLYNPDLKPLLYMPALSEDGFHRSHYLFSTNSCQTLLSNVPPVNQSIAATHRNQDKVPLVITAKSKFNYLHINPGQTASMHGRQGVW